MVLIRKVTDIAAVGIQEKNEAVRFEKAFAGVPRSVPSMAASPNHTGSALLTRTAGDCGTCSRIRRNAGRWFEMSY